MKGMWKRKQGLTIIELVVVMCILAVMVLISIPNIGRWLPRYRLRGAIRDVASAMQLARLGAIKENRQWAIQFDINAKTYTILRDDGADGTWGTADDIGHKGDGSPWDQSTTRLTDYPNVDPTIQTSISGTTDTAHGTPGLAWEMGLPLSTTGWSSTPMALRAPI